MTALLEAPTACAAAPPERRRGPVLLAAVLVLAGLVCSLVLWAPWTVALTAGATAFGGTAEVVTLPGYGARGTHVVDYRHGADVELVVPLRNDGRLPVRVVSAGTGLGPLPLLELAPVEPVTVPAGEARELVLRGRLGNCAFFHERSVQSVDGLLVRAEVLGLPSTREVPLDRPLLVHSPMIVSCPDRTLTRNDDRRTPSANGL